MPLALTHTFSIALEMLLRKLHMKWKCKTNRAASCLPVICAFLLICIRAEILTSGAQLRKTGISHEHEGSFTTILDFQQNL